MRSGRCGFSLRADSVRLTLYQIMFVFWKEKIKEFLTEEISNTFSPKTEYFIESVFHTSLQLSELAVQVSDLTAPLRTSPVFSLGVYKALRCFLHRKDKYRPAESWLKVWVMKRDKRPEQVVGVVLWAVIPLLYSWVEIMRQRCTMLSSGLMQSTSHHSGFMIVY